MPLGFSFLMLCFNRSYTVGVLATQWPHSWRASVGLNRSDVSILTIASVEGFRLLWQMFYLYEAPATGDDKDTTLVLGGLSYTM